MRIYLVLLVILAACTTPRKAVDVLSRPKNEPVAAEFCAIKYPVKDSIIKGDSIVHFDTLWETYTDTLISEFPQVIIETKLVPKTVTKTVTVRDTIIRENTARVSVLNSQIANLSSLLDSQVKNNEILAKNYSGMKSDRNKWKLRFFLLLFGVGLAYALKIKMTKKLW